MNKTLPTICLFFLMMLFLTSCSKTTFYTGSSQTGVFYNQLAVKTGGATIGGFSPSKRRYRNGRQVVPTETFHTVGLSFLPGIPGVASNRAEAYQFGYPTIGLHYHPRINLAKWSPNGSFSLDFPMHFGVSIGTDFVSYPNPNLVPKEKASFTAEIPMTFNFNFGHQATKNSTNNFGAFVGAGYSFAYLPSGMTGAYIFATNTTRYNLPIGHGPHGRLGIRFRTGTLGWQLYGSYMFNIYQASHLAGVGVGITFGRW